MGRAYSHHIFSVIVPTKHVDEIINRWGWKYCSDFFVLPMSSDEPYYQSARSSEVMGLTEFNFDSYYYWPCTQMMDDVHQISKQLHCRVFIAYCAGPECEYRLIVPEGQDNLIYLTAEDYWDYDDDDELNSYALAEFFNQPIQKLKQLWQPRYYAAGPYGDFIEDERLTSSDECAKFKTNEAPEDASVNEDNC